MDKVFDTIFAEIQSRAQQNLEIAPAPGDVGQPAPQASGQLPFNFQLDGNGNYTYSVSKYGAGVTVTASAVINAPDATYAVTITSSDGGGGSWTGVQAGQVLNFKIDTSFWNSTTITVTLSAPSAASQSGNGTINYSY